MPSATSYFIDLQSVYKDKIPEIGDKGSGTVRIPVNNNSDNLGRLVNIINSYYEVKYQEDRSDKIVNARQEMENEEMDYLDPVSTCEFNHYQCPSVEGHTQRYIRQIPSKINKYRAIQQPTVTCRYRVGGSYFV